MSENEASAIPLGERSYSSVEPDRPMPPAEVDPNNPPWGIGGAVVVLVSTLALSVFAPIILVFGYAFLQGYSLGPDHAPAFLQFISTDKTAIVMQIVALLPVHLVTLFLAWALVTAFGRRSFWASIGWGWGRWPPAKGLAICILLGVGLFMLGSAIAKLFGGDKPTMLEQIINSSLAARYLISFFAVATAPLVEEVIYRGVLYAPLQKHLGAGRAVMLVLLIFTAIHVPQYWGNGGVIAAIFVLSAALTVLRARTGRLLPCVVVHLVFNGIQAVILVLEPHLQRFVPTPEPVTPPASILLPLIGIFT